MIKLDTKGKPFKYPTVVLNRKEYAKIVGEINSIYYDTYKEQKFAFHYSIGIDNNYYVYSFENHGFNDYNIVDRFSI